MIYAVMLKRFYAGTSYWAGSPPGIRHDSCVWSRSGRKETMARVTNYHTRSRFIRNESRYHSRRLRPHFVSTNGKYQMG